MKIALVNDMPLALEAGHIFNNKKHFLFGDFFFFFKFYDFNLHVLIGLSIFNNELIFDLNIIFHNV